MAIVIDGRLTDSCKSGGSDRDALNAARIGVLLQILFPSTLKIETQQYASRGETLS
mgnify:CR=1 FL=1